MDEPLVCVASAELGKAFRRQRCHGSLHRILQGALFPTSSTLKGVKLVVDCAHGAGYHVAPPVFHELGAEVIAIGNDPDGLNINAGVGATHPEYLQAAVQRARRRSRRSRSTATATAW